MKIFNNLDAIFASEDYYPFFDVKPLRKGIVTNLQERFDYHISLAKCYFVEEYIEREWRELYSLHYSKTNYDISNKVTRIHFISERIDTYTNIKEDNYLGYITIRPLPSVINVVSRARLRFFKEQYNITKTDRIKINNIKTIVNLPHKTISYESFPFTTQDGVVTVCAHSDILMLSKYMYKKFNFNFLTTSSMLSYINQHNGRKIPNQGLLLEQMVEVLNKQNYNPSLFRFENLYLPIENEIKNEYEIEDIYFAEIIISAVLSGLPVLFLFENHVVIINGYIEKANGDVEFTIFDDSSYFMKKYFNAEKKYTANVKSEIIQKSIVDCKSQCNSQFAIIPTFDRFYFRYKELYILLNTKLKKIVTKSTKQDSFVSYKAGLIESKRLIRYSTEFDDIKFGHYVWYVRWYENGTFIGASLIDAVAHKNDFIKSIIVDFISKDDLEKTKRR